MPTRGQIITVLLTVITIICTVVSFTTYWYKIHSNQDYDIYISFMKEARESSEFTSRKDWYEESKRKREHALYGVCVAFVILSLVTTVWTFIIGALGSYGLLNSCIKLRVNLSFRIANCISLVFLLIGVLAFVRLPASTNADCKANDNTSVNFGSCNYYGCESFIGSYQYNKFKVTWGPYVGWAFGVIATIFSLASLIVSFFVSFQNPGGAAQPSKTSYQPQID